jgi:hypothetical protein
LRTKGAPTARPIPASATNTAALCVCDLINEGLSEYSLALLSPHDAACMALRHT